MDTLARSHRQARMALMSTPLLIIVVLSLFLGAKAQSPLTHSESLEQLRRAILATRHLGAHGLGYNDESLRKLSQELTPNDIPGLIDLLADKDLRVGIEFALASQCEAAIYPVREAALGHKMLFLNAEDTMQLIENFPACSWEARQRAAAMRSEIHSQGQAEQRRLEQEVRENAAEDARIQRNAQKLMDPKQAKELTRQEREEIFRRSLKAMGLKEDGPMTPAQRDLVQRMYRTMVLGEPGNRSPN